LTALSPSHIRHGQQQALTVSSPRMLQDYPAVIQGPLPEHSKMSVSCSLPQFPSHFMASLPSYLDSPPSSTQDIPHTSTSSTSRNSLQPSDLKRRRRQNANSSSPSSVSTESRVSKAKKGKRVHACEYPGCTKVCQDHLRVSAHQFL
jgi:hypothetical protein